MTLVSVSVKLVEKFIPFIDKPGAMKVSISMRNCQNKIVYKLFSRKPINHDIITEVIRLTFDFFDKFQLWFIAKFSVLIVVKLQV